MSLPCLWGDPALCHPSQPNPVNVSMQRSKSPELKRPLREIFDYSRLSRDWHLDWKRNLRGAADILCLSTPGSPVFQKTEKKISFSPRTFPLQTLTWESGFVSFMAPYISISICHLMAFYQCVQSGVDCANDNVSRRYVPCWAQRGAASHKTRRRYGLILCCAVVSDWWLSLL